MKHEGAQLSVVLGTEVGATEFAAKVEDTGQ